MPLSKQIDIKELRIDLENPRTVLQRNEEEAVRAMTAISPDRFWALMESIVDDGFYPTENVIVLKTKSAKIVKEGNRRVAILKIIHGLVKADDLPTNLASKIENLLPEWKTANREIPAVVFDEDDAEKADRIVALTHAKGEKASRDEWTAVAKARYERDKKGKSCPELDLLESYLKHGSNVTPLQGERWSGDYPLTVLKDTMQKLVPTFGYASIKDIVAAYPKRHKDEMDGIISDIGNGQLAFKHVRNKDEFFGANYGITQKEASRGKKESSGTSSFAHDTGTAVSTPNQASVSRLSSPKKVAAVPITDPRSIKRKLSGLKPKGTGNEKLAALIQEMRKLKINDHPHAFCFLLRSLFELSAVSYCKDNADKSPPSINKNDGNSKKLSVLLDEIIKHLTSNGADKERTKKLHGAKTELAKSEGILSVTSMNQLVHNSSFSIQPNDICILFGNIFPLLEEIHQ